MNGGNLVLFKDFKDNSSTLYEVLPHDKPGSVTINSLGKDYLLSLIETYDGAYATIRYLCEEWRLTYIGEVALNTHLFEKIILNTIYAPGGML